jgi:hypothetical protein
MVIKIVRRRLVVGLWKGEWDEVYLEPILETDDLTTPNHAPEIGLYSRSHGEATENEPMFGEVAWEPLLNHEYFGSSAKPERLMLQRKILWDAWRDLVAQDPADIAIIREQLQGSHRQRTLLRELDKARKARTNSIRQKEQRRARKAQRLDPDAPAASIEVSDDDSGLGSDTEDDDEEDIDNEDGRRMPPPSQAANRRPSGARRGPVARSSPMMSDGLGNFGSADRSTASSSSQTNAAKRKRPADPELQRNPHARSESQHLFMTPEASGRPRPEQNLNGEDDGEFDMLGGHDANGGLSEKAAIATARARSLAPGGDGSVLDGNGGLNFDEAMRAATRASMAPEDGS